MYRSPSLELQAAPARTHQLALVATKGEVPGAAGKNIPPHLKDHPALRGERGAKLVLHGATTLVVLGIGKPKDFTEQEACEWGEHAGHALNKEHVEEIQVLFPSELGEKGIAINFLKGLLLGNYRFEELKSKSDQKKQDLKKVYLNGGAATLLDKSDLQMITALAQAIAFARGLTELPPAHGDAQNIVRRFQEAADKGRIEIEVWDEKRIKKEGMGLFEAVAQGSDTPPRFLIARYGKDLKSKSHLFLVGKGVTFDTGGINLKTGSWQDLLWMKKDMGGAAAVLGAMLAISQLRPGIQVTAVTPLTSNAIGPGAIHPGDVVTAYSGKTVEIMNTDAEGRLILADALHYAVKNKASHIVDVATLTGACMVALGHHNSGLFTNSTEFGDTVRKVCDKSGEPAWPMPMSPRYGEELKSKVADFSNMGKSREGGATIGAKFLERFVENVPWVHLDIAGTVDLGEPAAGGAYVPAAGRMVHALTALAVHLAGESSKKK